DEVHLHLLVPADHHDILHHTGCGLACDAHELEAVPVEVNRVDVVARIAHAQAVAPACMDLEEGTHSLHGERLSVEGPLIEATACGVDLREHHVDGVVRRRCDAVSEPGVVPAARPGRGPLRLALCAC